MRRGRYLLILAEFDALKLDGAEAKSALGHLIDLKQTVNEKTDAAFEIISADFTKPKPVDTPKPPPASEPSPNPATPQ